MRIKGERRIGKTIRKLENSVEFSDKESSAKVAEEKRKEKDHRFSECADDSPIQSLRELALRKKKKLEP